MEDSSIRSYQPAATPMDYNYGQSSVSASCSTITKVRFAEIITPFSNRHATNELRARFIQVSNSRLPLGIEGCQWQFCVWGRQSGGGMLAEWLLRQCWVCEQQEAGLTGDQPALSAFPAAFQIVNLKLQEHRFLARISCMWRGRTSLDSGRVFSIYVQDRLVVSDIVVLQNCRQLPLFATQALFHPEQVTFSLSEAQESCRRFDAILAGLPWLGALKACFKAPIAEELCSAIEFPAAQMRVGSTALATPATPTFNRLKIILTFMGKWPDGAEWDRTVGVALKEMIQNCWNRTSGDLESEAVPSFEPSPYFGALPGKKYCSLTFFLSIRSIPEGYDLLLKFEGNVRKRVCGS